MSSLTPRIDLLERNLIINGNMDFWQRGTSFATVNTDKYTADRFIIDTNGATTGTASQSTDVPLQNQSGYQSRYSWLYTQGSTTGTNAVGLRYVIEGQDYQNIHARPFRLQFWVKSSVTGVYSVGLFNGSGIAGTRNYVTTYTIASANTWQKVIIDLTADSSGSWNFDTASGLTLFWSLCASTGNGGLTSSLNVWQAGSTTGSTTQTANVTAVNGSTWQLAQVMLTPQNFVTPGSATADIPFQRAGRSIGHELAMCQRYYYRPDWENYSTGTWMAVGQVGNSATNIYVALPLPAAMRAQPTLSRSGMVLNSANGSTVALTGAALSSAHGNTAGVAFTVASGLVSGNATLLQKNGSTDFIAFDAEL